MVAVVAVLAAGRVSPSTEVQTSACQTVSLASTIGPVDAGVIPALEKAYLGKYPNVAVRHYKAGTGATLEIAKRISWIW